MKELQLLTHSRVRALPQHRRSSFLKLSNSVKIFRGDLGSRINDIFKCFARIYRIFYTKQYVMF